MGDNTSLQDLYEKEYQRGYEAARMDAINAIKKRAERWREKDRKSPTRPGQPEFIKVRIAEGFEISQALLRIGNDTEDAPNQLREAGTA